MKSISSLLNISLLLAVLLFAGSCNSKSDEPDESYTFIPSVAVNSFSLNADSKVMADLDSVHFSIDLEHGVVFNADSLPLGTDVSKLVANISFPSSVTSAFIEMKNGKVREGMINYKENTLDSIDFTGKVFLTLSTDDNLSKIYQLKVNVHQTKPDSIIWDKMASAPYPSRLKNPLAQRTVEFKGNICMMVEENDGSYSWAQAADPASSQYTISTLQLPFKPQLRSLHACCDELFILADNGSLYSSPDGTQWSQTSVVWDNIIGSYGNSLLGLRRDNGVFRHTYFYPENSSSREGESASEGFPVTGFSNFVIFSSDWSDEATGFLVGGFDSDGRSVSKTWAYDGSNWTDISNISLPALSGVTLIPYYIYRRTSSSFVRSEFSVWLAVGGKKEDGSLNRTVYMSYDTGVNWGKAPMLMQLPDFVPALTDADAIVRSSAKSFDLTDNWKARKVGRPKIAKLTYEIDGTDVKWECPYIYIFGGINADDNLNNTIWRGVLARLSYPPLF